MPWWSKLTGFFARPKPPVVRLCNAILLTALKDGATKITIDREQVCTTVDGITTTMMRLPDNLFEPTVAQLETMGGGANRVASIHLRTPSGTAQLEMRPYGREGVVLTIDPLP